MHQLATIPNKPTIAEVRALVREDGSSLLDHVTDDQIDEAIRQDIDRPAITLRLVAEAVILTLEFDVLCDWLREAVVGGSVLDSEPATDEELRVFRRVATPHFDNPVLAHAQEVAGRPGLTLSLPD